MGVLDTICRSIANSARGRHWLRRLGAEQAFQPVFDLVANRTAANFRMLADLGLAPEVVIDVGAYRGEWTTMMRPIFPAARFAMLEAQPECEPDLRRVVEQSGGMVEMAIGLLGREPRDAVEFFLGETGSSIYAENTAFAMRPVQLPMTTLDITLRGMNSQGSCLLKLDVQGAELDVLAGAPETLARAEAVLMEASITEYNIGAPRIADMIAAMGEAGFNLFDICDLRRIGPVLAQTDLVFVRRGGPLEQKALGVIQTYGR